MLETRTRTTASSVQYHPCSYLTRASFNSTYPIAKILIDGKKMFLLPHRARNKDWGILWKLKESTFWTLPNWQKCRISTVNMSVSGNSYRAWLARIVSQMMNFIWPNGMLYQYGFKVSLRRYGVLVWPYIVRWHNKWAKCKHSVFKFLLI